MNKSEQRIIADNKEDILREVRHAFSKRGVTNIAINLSVFKADCVGGYWEEYTVYDKRKKKNVTKLRHVCP